MRELIQGELLKVGDIIETTSCFGKRSEIVTRVTDTLAICEGKSKSRYRRLYDWQFGLIPYDREQALFVYKVYCEDK